MANETILIVDADAKSQKVLEVSFKKAGYRVALTDSPVEARRLIVAEQPDLIISDTKFPDGDGFELLATLKEAGSTRDVPFIFLTEERSLPQKMRGFELGADDYLTKPVYIKEVTTRVELLLQKRNRDMMSEAHIEEFSGDLSDITMIDLLQTIEEELRSGSIRLRREGREAVVYFREGNILDAICGKLQGEEAIYRLMLWPEGTFRMEYHENVRRPDRIEKDSSALLLEGIRRLEEWNELTVELSFEKVYEADYLQLPTLLDSLPTEVARIARLFDGLRTVRDVLDDSPLDDVTTMRIVRKLFDDQVLKDVSPRAQGTPSSQRSNLAMWLDGKGKTSETREREDTSPKFGAVSRVFDLDAEPKSVPELTQPESVSADVDTLDLPRDDGPSWKFHFDAPNPDDAIRKIEEDEEKRREEEARRLATSRQVTLGFVPAMSRDSSVFVVSSPAPTLLTPEPPQRVTMKLFDEIEVAEKARREAEARSTDRGFGTFEEVSRPKRVTEPMREAISRTAPVIDEMLDEARAESKEEDEQTIVPRRVRQTTPMTTPVLTTRSETEPSTGAVPDDDVEQDEASTAELHGPAVARIFTESPRGADVAEVPIRPEDVEHFLNGDETWGRLHADSEVRENEVFDERTPTPFYVPTLSYTEVESSEDLASTKRATKELFSPAAHNLTPLSEELPPESTPVGDLPHLLIGLGEIEPELVPRLARDGELVTSVITLKAGSQPVLQTPTSELETQELDDRSVSEEQAFFSQNEMSNDDFGVVDEGARVPWLLVAGVLGVLALLVILVMNSGEKEVVNDKPVAVATKPEEKVENTIPVVPVVEPPVESAPDESQLVALATEAAQQVDGQAVEKAMLLAGALTDPSETTSETIPTEPVAVPVEAVDKPIEKLDEQPVEQPAATDLNSRIAGVERLIKDENFEGALNDIGALAAEAPDNGKIAYLHGRAALGAMRTKEAIDQFKRAERRGFRPASLYLDLGSAYWFDGKVDLSKAAYEKFLQLKPNGKDAEEVRAILDSYF